jgi:hypothetical protein
MGPKAGLAQIKVDTDISIQQAITKLVGQGVRVSNVRVDCPSSKGRPYGYFTDNTGTLGMDDGLVITTGSAQNAVGPNNSALKGQDNSNDTQDPDLRDIIVGNETQFDACIIEFDVEVFADTLTFDFVFGSEEYLEFIKEYHDVFGFFISGPGIVGKKNLAVLPNTQTTISVSNVNNSTNSQYYIDNGMGSTPFDNLFLQYDGYTKRLESKVAVIPCEQYRLKLAICDIKDGMYDAGIFIAGKSLKTKAPKLAFRYEYNKFQTAIEGCNGTFVTVTRQSRLNEPITFFLKYSGTATQALDYGPVPESISFLPGESVKEFFIPVFGDNISDENENILIDLLNPCPGLPQVDQMSIPIRETFEFEMPDARICAGDSVLLNTNPALGYSYQWTPADFLTCTSCPQPIGFPPFSKDYFVEITESESGCKASDSLKITVDPLPIAGFTFTSKPDYSSLDVFFENESLNADAYTWTFGDGSSSSEKDPGHFYSSGLNQDSISYTIVLKAKNSIVGCEDSASARVSIGNPLFIPNLITVNTDGINEAFFIRGILPGIWKLEVFDRWGKRVFDNSSYQLDWNAKDLQNGVYFFLLQNPNGDRKFPGWIKVWKE